MGLLHGRLTDEQVKFVLALPLANFPAHFSVSANTT
jgi:hypothetical protein